MTQALDLSYLQAVPIVTMTHRHVEFILVGCGGNGGWLAPNLARLLKAIEATGRTASALFIDPDIVEEVNVPRQNFTPAEIGLSKAKVLAARYGLAYGIHIGAIAAPFNCEMISYHYHKVTILIGCVDNAEARVELNNALSKNTSYSSSAPRIWWLDCGNHAGAQAAGQVLLGSTNELEALESAFNTRNFCIHLPSPVLQHPELLQPLPEELLDNRLSCAELALANHQSLFVNQRVTAEAADYLLRLTLSHNLKRFATYFDLSAGSCRSTYVTPDNIQRFAKSAR